MNNKAMTPLDELNLTDGFLFAETMDESFSRRCRRGTRRIWRREADTIRHSWTCRFWSRMQLIHSRVEKIRRSEKCGVKYMQRWEELVYARQDGYEEGRSEGFDRGRGEGALREIITAVCKKLAKGKSAGQIADELEQELSRISRICQIAEKYVPAYNQDAIYQEWICTS